MRSARNFAADSPENKCGVRRDSTVDFGCRRKDMASKKDWVRLGGNHQVAPTRTQSVWRGLPPIGHRPSFLCAKQLCEHGFEAQSEGSHNCLATRPQFVRLV